MTESKNSTWKIYTAAVIFSLIVGFSFLGVKTAVGVATPLQTLTYRFDFAFLAAVLLPLTGLVKVELRGKSRRSMILSAGGYLGFMVFQTIGLLFASSIESGIIFAVIPILANIIAHFALGEKGTALQNLFVTLSVAALIAMFVLGAQEFRHVSITGLILLLLASVLMAVSNVAMRYARKEYRPYTISFVITGSGCLFFNAATLLLGLAGNGGESYFAPLAHPEFLIATVFLGIPSTLLSALLMAYMLAHMQAVKATIFGNLSTAISLVVGALILSEPLYTYHIVCTALIVTGVIGTSASGKRNGNEGGTIKK